MRRFSSYGPLDLDLHYYAPRQKLINKAFNQLIGNNKGGHYITVWAPRQSGKTWTLQQVVKKIKLLDMFEVAIISMGSGKSIETRKGILNLFCSRISEFLKISLPELDMWEELKLIFSSQYFSKPLILIIDEFDALDEKFINQFANEFREMYISRQNEDNPSNEKTCILHGLALIGVRSVLGIENVKGSPFNVQRSTYIPCLTKDEVKKIYQWYEKESQQKIEPEVIEKIYYEFKGQPGLTCWFGEVITEMYNKEPDKPITIKHFNRAYTFATHALPNNNIINIISKAKIDPYKEIVLDLFKTDQKKKFSYDDYFLNYLYMNGIIDIDDQTENDGYIYVRFASPFVQKRLFNFFSRELFREMGQLIEPFTSLKNIINENRINIKNVMRLYEEYLRKNRHWLLNDAPKRKDLRIFEAVYHFNLYMYLNLFLHPKNAYVYPEFPTGNGKIDIIIKYFQKVYGIELKTYTDESSYKKAILKAASYGKQLQVKKIYLVFFIEFIDEENRSKYEIIHNDKNTGVSVEIIFIMTGT